ncbi:molybdopterin-dependent oxidoreductase [Novosphingobium colocasiae]
MTQIAQTFCRLCAAYCPIEVELANGRPVKVMGDRSAPLYGGYTCVKGRALPKIHLNPSRLRYSVKRDASGEHRPIATARAIDEIADKISDIIARHGPRSVALYLGNPTLMYPGTAAVGVAFMTAIGSPMLFSSQSIDQPGLVVSQALHGSWHAGRIAAADADAFLIAGGNPVISKQYLSQNPARKLKDRVNDGVKLIVIDPRRTETARRAHVHLQVKPGEDAVVLAGLVRLLIENGKIDESFVAENVVGLADLARALRPFTPEAVAARASIDAEQLREAAAILGNARRAYIGGGTGISMSGHGNLSFYLLLCLQSIRGFWPRAGDDVAGPSVLMPPVERKAQPVGPTPANFGETLRVRGLRQSNAGMPTGGLPEEILTPGEGQVRALICLGNPLACWPDSELALRAMGSLELLITPNVEISATSKLAHYVIATRHVLETPATTQFIEGAKMIHYGYGWDAPYAQYTPALLEPPAGSDLVEDWQIFYRIAKRMNVPLAFCSGTGLSMSKDGAAQRDIDMDVEPTTEQLFDIICANSAVPLAEVRSHLSGKIYEEAQREIAPRNPDCEDRLDVANPDMLDQLASIADDLGAAPCSNDFPFMLIPRRADDVVNSTFRYVPGMHKTAYNPAFFLHPDDMSAIHVEGGQLIEISSRYGSVIGVAEADRDLRRGVLSMTHGSRRTARRSG